MKNLQIGESCTGDLKECTWTFQMDSDFKLTAGEFAIIPKSDFEEYKLEKNMDLISSFIDHVKEEQGISVSEYVFESFFNA